MVASSNDIDNWVERGKEMKAKYIISVCDTYDWDDYPVFVLEGEDLEKRKEEFDGRNMQKINEVITLEYEPTV